MDMRRGWAMAFVIGALAVWPAWAQGDAKTWHAEQVAVVERLHVPECVAPDPANGVAYIANVDAVEDEYWSDDGKGFVSLIASDGQMKNLRWVESKEKAIMNGPKGMVLFEGYLYINDNARLLRCPVATAGPVEVVPLPKAEHLNDAATDGRAVFVTDTTLSLINRVELTGAVTTFPAPEMINGITFFDGRMFGVSWSLHEVYELDAAGKAAPKPFGVASHFAGLDGIEVLDDGTFIVSDFVGNKVCTIAPDRKTVRTLVELESPADIGLDRTRNLLYVPQFMKDRVVVLKLDQR